MLEKTGVPTNKQIREIFPEESRINEGPVVVIECYKEIPCNPCTTACKFDSIHIGEDINKRPEVIEENCIGCSVCLSKCPGLAIMLVDGSKSEDFVHMTIPYEFLPLPEEGDIVDGLDRKGEFIEKVEVLKIINPKSYDRTPLIKVKVSRNNMYEFKNIRLEEE